CEDRRELTVDAFFGHGRRCLPGGIGLNVVRRFKKSTTAGSAGREKIGKVVNPLRGRNSRGPPVEIAPNAAFPRRNGARGPRRRRSGCALETPPSPRMRGEGRDERACQPPEMFDVSTYWTESV